MDKDTVKCISIAEKPGTFGVGFHNQGYKLFGLNYAYFPLKITPSELELFIAIVRNNFHGCSVSMPHKIEVIKYLDSLEESAQKCDAVNTILNNKGILRGYNTDYYGAKRAISSKADITNKDVIMLGAGGAARAIGRAVKDLGGKLTIINRTEERAVGLAEKLNSHYLAINKLDYAVGCLLINATSIGMNNNEESIFSKELLKRFDVVMDVVIGETSLVEEARRLNKIVIPGMLMTVYQAAKQFGLYTGKELPEEFLRRFYGRI